MQLGPINGLGVPVELIRMTMAPMALGRCNASWDAPPALGPARIDCSTLSSGLGVPMSLMSTRACAIELGETVTNGQSAGSSQQP